MWGHKWEWVTVLYRVEIKDVTHSTRLPYHIFWDIYNMLQFPSSVAFDEILTVYVCELGFFFWYFTVLYTFYERGDKPSTILKKLTQSLQCFMTYLRKSLHLVALYLPDLGPDHIRLQEIRTTLWWFRTWMTNLKWWKWHRPVNGICPISLLLLPFQSRLVPPNLKTKLTRVDSLVVGNKYHGTSVPLQRVWSFPLLY